MGKPDALSRQADHGSGSEDNSNLTLLKPELFAVHATEGLELNGEEVNILQNICCACQAGHLEDTVAKAAALVSKKRGFTNQSLHHSEWSDRNGILDFRGHIYVPKVLEL